MVFCVRCNSESKNESLCEECEGNLQNRINVVLEEEFPQTEGYDSKYFVDFPKYFECPLCLGGLRDPVQIAGECGHVFCGSCLNRATPGEPKTCPLDREPFIQTFPDRSKRREILSLKVTCQNNGCLWKGELSDLLDHLRRNCGRLLLSCLNSDCPEKLCREKMIEHCLECKFAPGIPCAFVQFGCQFEGTRSAIDNHMNTYVNKHLALTTAKINEQDNKVNQQDDKIKELNNRIEQILDIYKTKNNKFNELEIRINVLQENNNDLKIQNAEIIKNNQDLNEQHEELQKVYKELKINHERLQGKFDILQSDFDNKDNIFSWKISNYQGKGEDAKQGFEKPTANRNVGWGSPELLRNRNKRHY